MGFQFDAWNKVCGYHKLKGLLHFVVSKCTTCEF